MCERYNGLHILLCESRSLSYGSSGFFLKKMEEEMRNMGVHVDHFYLEAEQKNIDDLEQFIGKSYTAIMDINSILPCMVCEDGSYLLDHIDAPFYNYIVDHPMHLHPILAETPKNYFVICLDQEHKQYIEKYYSHIRGVLVMPLAGTQSSNRIPYQKRQWDVYFPATYVPLTEYHTKLQQNGTDDWKLASAFLEEWKQNEAMELTDWFLEKETPLENAVEEIHRRCRYIDRYIREVYRHQIIEILLEEGVTIHVSGAYWNYYDGAAANRLVVHSACDYETMLQQMENSRVVINVQPLFQHAPHDRILNGMANGALLFTDSCTFLRECFRDTKPYVSYDWKYLKESAAKFADLLKDQEAMEQMAKEARDFVLQNNTWYHWIKAFLEYLTR